jgi:Transposase
MAHATAAQPITVGVDTHLDSHVAHANDQLGRGVGTCSVPTTPTGYQDLLAWARGLGQPIAWGVEGTGSYGAALARFLAANGQVVVEVNRPDRQARRRGKSSLALQMSTWRRPGRPTAGLSWWRRGHGPPQVPDFWQAPPSGRSQAMSLWPGLDPCATSLDRPRRVCRYREEIILSGRCRRLISELSWIGRSV